jgi:hypothetical protein
MNKLYVLVRGDLTHGQQMAQACHALADFMLYHNTSCSCCPDLRWSNDTIVILKTKNEQELSSWLEVFRANTSIAYAHFNEPDLNGELTAIAAHGIELPKFLKKLSLA